MKKNYDEYCTLEDIKAFYNDLNHCKIETTCMKLVKLNLIAKKLRNECEQKNYNSLLKKYISIMEKIKTYPKKYLVENNFEKYVLFMFTIDPNFEALKTIKEVNNLKEAKQKLINLFGVYDPNLYKFERVFIKHYFSIEEQKKFEEEANKRAFK